MKFILITLALLLTLPVHATVLSERATLHNWSIDANSPLLENEILEAQVEVNHQAKNIYLNLMTIWECPAGLFCATVMPTLLIQFEMTGLSTDVCGVRTITGLNDSHQHIRITDYTLNHCSENIIEDMIVVHFTVAQGEDILSIDRFSGDRFIKGHDRGLVEGHIDGGRKIEFGHQQVVIETAPVQAFY